MDKVAIIMTGGLADRVNAIEHALEENDPETLDIYWIQTGCESYCNYFNVSFNDYFDSNLNNKDIFIPHNIMKDINLVKKYLLSFNNYKNFYISHGGRVIRKYKKDPQSILFPKYTPFKRSKNIFTNNNFLGVHFRWYCYFKDNENFFFDFVEAFKNIYDTQKKYFMSTDSEKAQEYYSDFPNIYTIRKIYDINGFIKRALDDTKHTLDEIHNLGNCNQIYASMGGFAYLAAAQSQNKPPIIELAVKEEYKKYCYEMWIKGSK